MIYRGFDIEELHEKNFRRTILIVDDEPVNLRMMGNILGEEYDIVYASSGMEALETVKKQKDFLSLILLDLYMPGMHGYEVLDKLREDDELKKIPVVVLTTDKEAEVECLQRGAVDFLSKPFEKPEVIKARIRRSIELYIDRDIINNAGIDKLTGLFTKQFFLNYAQEFDKFHPNQGTDAIVVNFSKFHLLNELYGRSYGDKVLCCMADGIRTVARTCGGIASRVDADIFYMYIEHQEDYDFLVNEIKRPLTSMMKFSDIRLRIGIYQDIFHTATLDQRFDRALIACNTHAKFLSGEPYALYDNHMHEQELYEARLLENIEKALGESQFSIVFQPKYDITGSEPKLCSAEALVRWKHPIYGNVKPDFFIPLFEDNGLIKELDRFVWAEAAKQVRSWKDMYGVSIPLSVNVSRVDVFDPELMEYLVGLTKDIGIEPEELHLEITETAYTENTAQMIKVVKELQEKGYKLEMDDFGKGYSSLNMLTELPIDALKLDMAFIKSITEDNKALKMVEFILNIGEFLNVPVIAEGVETAEQYVLLKEAGCNIVQGYYFSKPISAAEFGLLIEKNLMGTKLQGDGNDD